MLGVSVMGTVVTVAVADVFNATHLFNPDWPAHARFHIAMQFTALCLVSLVSLWALFGAARAGQAWLAALAPATFWPGLLVAWMVPGTDPYATEALRSTGVPINIIAAVVFLGITGWGVHLARHRE
ncbi:hypothetical protein GWI72_13600 [Microvirga tunisiensis]|uniref:Uncharacterized protein n=2 Tax=Pannonibacter tanglangensis TaxID=2750084 RepID=A0A7X5JAC8_9HYPH|nr:hypothetical protein [Pannonibacter sp. XCT-34]NBN79306.1 hypothetical protein [Pannonibacter sp. XCT-53]